MTAATQAAAEAAAAIVATVGLRDEVLAGRLIDGEARSTTASVAAHRQFAPLRACGLSILLCTVTY